jgi:hypothetical protein
VIPNIIAHFRKLCKQQYICPFYFTFVRLYSSHTEQGGKQLMKTAAMNHTPFMARPIIPLPNVVTRRQFLHKALDGALIFFSGVGIAVMLAVFLLLC